MAGIGGYRHQRRAHRPVEAGRGVFGREATPSIDGHFDRISTQIDEVFGTDVEFRRLCEVAAAHGGIVIDDIVPGHTGKGADFRLAEMKSGTIPGSTTWWRSHEDWQLLPEVPPGKDSVNLDSEAEERLERAGYIVGRLQRVIFQDQGSRTPTGARPPGHRPGWGPAALGLPALLQGRSALDQLAGSDVRRDAPGDW